jgi:hypothetical protein
VAKKDGKQKTDEAWAALRERWQRKLKRERERMGIEGVDCLKTEVIKKTRNREGERMGIEGVDSLKTEVIKKT